MAEHVQAAHAKALLYAARLAKHEPKDFLRAKLFFGKTFTFTLGWVGCLVFIVLSNVLEGHAMTHGTLVVLWSFVFTGLFLVLLISGYLSWVFRKTQPW